MMDKTSRKSRANILIVDDELGPRESLRMILKNRYNTLTADSGKEALDLIRKHSIDLVTLDLRMPGLSGMEALEKIKEINRDIEIIIITGYGSKDTIEAGIEQGIYDYFTKPFSVAEVVASINRGVNYHNAIVSAKAFLIKLEEATLWPLDLAGPRENLWIQTKSGVEAGNSHPLAQRTRAKGSPEFNHVEFARSVATALEKDDKYFQGHSLATAGIAMSLADELTLSAEETRIVELGALLHDVGMVTVPREVIACPGPLNDDMSEYIREHPLKSGELVDCLELEERVVEAVLSHHEMYDGAGYPRGMSGTEIPQAARIIALSDAFQAMISNRPYRTAFSWDMALEAIRRGCETQFDPEIGASFCGLLAQGRIGIDKYGALDSESRTEH